MCGRYAVQHDPAALAEEFEAVDRTGGAVVADFNVTPTKTVPIVVQRGAERSIRPVRWGLVPTWAKEIGSGPPMINARAESITTKPAFAESARRRRCLMPATGWYEWQPGDRRRQPFLCRREDGASLAMAAVFSAWWAPDSTDRPLVTCAVVTTDAVGELADIHHRMPLVLPRDRWSDWLDPQRTEISELLTPVKGMLDELALHPVSTEVNSMRNNHPDLLRQVEPVPEPAEQAALFES
ncbi:SOS response-associated peptidase [Saccharopolyspora sp. NPDC000359]|uniref:SOS response-associated peptidase n=1 Tax=Saccharopolyspora sp. NPDC000359 TaxID=3154251 RepID=UPI00332878B0